MRTIFTLIIIILVLWAFDAYVFDGRYGGAFELEANNQGRSFYHHVQTWLDRNLPTR